MTSTNTLPETSFPLDSVKSANIAKEQGIEALKDIAYGSVSLETRYLLCTYTNTQADCRLSRQSP